MVSPAWERPARLEALAAGVATLEHATVSSRRHGDELLAAVHDPGLVAFLRDGHAAWRASGGPEVMIPDTFVSSRWATGGPPASPMAAPGWWCIDTATPVVAGSYAAARAAVDVALTAAGEVLDGTRAAYAMTRPPGHHAGIRTYGGFCLLNPAAITARSLSVHGRVAVVDVDAHHGNGTQEIFWEDPDVLYASLHADPAWRFPYVTGAANEIGGGRGRGTTRNTPLGPGTQGASYLPALTHTLEAVEAFDPTTVVVSLGFDAAAVDPIGGLGLDLATYAEVGRLLAALDRPTVLVQEGGYAVDHLGELLTTTLAPFTA